MRHIYQIIDGGETYFYSAESKERAREQHIDLHYKSAGVFLEESEIDDEVIEMSDSKLLKCGGYEIGEQAELIADGGSGYVEMPAQEWAAKLEGFVACTIF